MKFLVSALFFTNSSRNTVAILFILDKHHISNPTSLSPPGTSPVRVRRVRRVLPQLQRARHRLRHQARGPRRLQDADLRRRPPGGPPRGPRLRPGCLLRGGPGPRARGQVRDGRGRPRPARQVGRLRLQRPGQECELQQRGRGRHCALRERDPS